jgi:4-amino-4-deoxychorismate lyase
MNLTISKVRRNSTSRLCYIKSTCYIENLIEKEEAKKNGFDDVIFLNENGYVTETSCANIFIVKNNEIFTPRISDGLLDGIIRRKIIENFKVQEKSITFEELKKSDEVIITNSLMGAMSIKKLDDIKYEKIELRDIFNKCIISI